MLGTPNAVRRAVWMMRHSSSPQMGLRRARQTLEARYVLMSSEQDETDDGAPLGALPTIVLAIMLGAGAHASKEVLVPSR